jgi:hypothetical protein
VARSKDANYEKCVKEIIKVKFSRLPPLYQKATAEVSINTNYI